MRTLIAVCSRLVGPFDDRRKADSASDRLALTVTLASCIFHTSTAVQHDDDCCGDDDRSGRSCCSPLDNFDSTCVK